jgi:hypothetical protein
VYALALIVSRGKAKINADTFAKCIRALFLPYLSVLCEFLKNFLTKTPFCSWIQIFQQMDISLINDEEGTIASLFKIDCPFK